MKFLEPSPIKKRIAFGFGLIIIIFILIGVVASYEVKSLSRLTFIIYNHPLTVSNAALQANVGVVKMHRSMQDVVLAEEHQQIEKALSKVNDEAKRVYHELDIVKKRILGPEGQALINETLTLFDAWLPIREEVIDLVRKGDKEEAALITNEKEAEHVLLLENKMTELNFYARKKADSFITATQKVHNRSILFTNMAVLVGIILSSAIAFLTTRQIMETFSRKKEAEKLLEEIFSNMKSGGGIYRAVNNGEDFIILAHKKPADQIELQNPGQKLAGKHFLDVFPAARQYGLFDALRRVWKTGIPENFPVTIYDGDTITAWRSNYVFRLSTGEVASIYEDNTSSKQLEKALLENEYLFRSIFNTSPCSINMNRLDDGKFVMINQKFLELTGYEKDEIIDKTAIDINIWKDIEKRQEFFAQLVDKWQVNDFEADFRRKDGRIITAMVSGKLLSYRNEPHLLAVTRDITQLKQIQHDLIAAHAQLEKKYTVSTEKLKESEIKYSSLVDTMLTGVHMIVEGRIVFVNRKFAKMFGYRKDELLGMNITELIHPDDQEGYIRIYRTNFDEEAGYEVRGIMKNGDTICLFGRNTPIDFNGLGASLGIFSNITSLKEAEKQRRKSEEELRSLSAQLLSAEERERKRIARDIHDSIGQSLSAIKFSVENALVAIDAHSVETAQEALKKIIPISQQSIDEVRRIIMDLRPSTLDDLGLVATISWFCREFENVFGHIRVERFIKVKENDIPETLKTVIYRIVQEALNNAAKYSGADTIFLRIVKPAGDLELHIEDQGIGFNMDLLAERDRQRRGMGLSSMKERVYLSGGAIKILSAPGSGTQINIVWPASALITATDDAIPG